MPGRPLEDAIRSIRPQVDEMRVYLNGYPMVPEYLRALDCQWVLDPENKGGEKGLHWTRTWDGYYFTVDDDQQYPTDYVARYVEELQRFGDNVVVAAHGRRFADGPCTLGFQRPLWIHQFQRRQKVGRWGNHCGSGVMAFHTKLNVPDTWPVRNCISAQFAVWAQEHGVPIWLLPHNGKWIHPLCVPGRDSIWLNELSHGFAVRNAVLAAWERWTVHTLDQDMEQTDGRTTQLFEVSR